MEPNLKNKITFLHILVVTFILLVIMILLVAGSVRDKNSRMQNKGNTDQEIIHGELAPFDEVTQEASVSAEPR